MRLFIQDGIWFEDDGGNVTNILPHERDFLIEALQMIDEDQEGTEITSDDC